MQVCLVDHRYSPEIPSNSKWYVALRSKFDEVKILPESLDGSEWKQPRSPLSNPDAIVFVHSKFREDWKRNAVKMKGQIVLVREQGAEPVPSNVGGNLHSCYWRPEQFERCNLGGGGERISQLVNQILAGNVLAIDWGLLQPGDDIRTAVSVLCQGFLTVAASSLQSRGVNSHSKEVAAALSEMGWSTVLSPTLVVSQLSGNNDDKSPENAYWSGTKSLRKNLLKSLVSECGEHGDPSRVISEFLIRDSVTIECVAAVFLLVARKPGGRNVA